MVLLLLPSALLLRLLGCSISNPNCLGDTGEAGRDPGGEGNVLSVPRGSCDFSLCDFSSLVIGFLGPFCSRLRQPTWVFSSSAPFCWRCSCPGAALQTWRNRGWTPAWKSVSFCAACPSLRPEGAHAPGQRPRKGAWGGGGRERTPNCWAAASLLFCSRALAELLGLLTKRPARGRSSDRFFGAAWCSPGRSAFVFCSSTLGVKRVSRSALGSGVASRVAEHACGSRCFGITAGMMDEGSRACGTWSPLCHWHLLPTRRWANANPS